MNAERSQFALIGMVLRPENETPWLVQDNRKALKNEYPCATKADVLNQVAAILDEMRLPPNKVEEEVGVTVAVTLKASLCDPGSDVNTQDLRRAAAEAVGNAVHYHEAVGFDHALAAKVSLGVVEVRALNVGRPTDP